MENVKFNSLRIGLWVLSALLLAGSATPLFATGLTKSQATLTRSIVSRVERDRVFTKNVGAEVSSGGAMLLATVPTTSAHDQASQATDLAAHRILTVNALKKTSPVPSDSLIGAEVMHRIHICQPYTVFDWVTAHSKNGVVTLKGWVSQLRYIGEYQKQAARVVGVKKVVNDIKFTMGYRRLAWRAVKLIYREDMFPGSLLTMNPPVHIIAYEGYVILEGKVGSTGLAAYLANLVTYHTDAIRVFDNLQVRG